MPNNRTPEWARVSRSGFLSVFDQPGEINIRAAPPLIAPIRLLFGCVALGIAVISLPLALAEQEGFIIAGIAAVLATTYLWGFRGVYWHAAYRVRFTPHAVEFFNLFGRRMGGIEREALQQVAIESVPYRRTKDETKSLHFHMFYGDTGYRSAFPQKNERDAIMRNNILMAACQQPVHLDL